MDYDTDLGFYSRRVAVKVGLAASVIYAHICYWIRKNKANEKHFYNGKYWTYNSMKAFASYFPELTEKQVRTALEKLIQANLIESANFNKTGYDRTLWYSLKEENEDYQIDMPKNELPFAQKGTPIPNINQTDKQSVKKENIKKKESLELPLGEMETNAKTQEKPQAKSELDEQAAKIYELYPRKAARPDAIKAIKKALKVEGYTDLYAKTQKYATAVKESQKELSYIPYPATWFNREEYNDDWSGIYQTSPRNRRLRVNINEQHYDRTPYINPDDPDDIPF
jgi:hypothetical protein